MSTHTASRQLDRRILRLALPNILSNLTIPLLGMIDLALAGHLEDAYAIGGIAIATTIFNLIYWNFAFLRMGTTGLTAQSHGAGDKEAMGRNLVQSLVIGLAGGLLILLFQKPLFGIARWILSPEPQLTTYAAIYYNIVIWGAPASLCTYALNGWLIGMQNTWWPMLVSIVTNVINIAISATLVIIYGYGIDGIATGTVIAQYIGATLLALGGYFLFIRKKGVELPQNLASLRIGLRRYFSTNIHILLRTMLLALVSLFFTYAGTQQGALTLAANALLYQFFTLYSYFIDGFAYAAEAVVGHFYGMREHTSLRLSIRKLVTWGFFLALGTCMIYILVAEPFLGVLTDKADVIAYARNYLFWVYLLPFTGFVAFLYDGIFVGVTATKSMLWSMFVAVLVFFALFYGLPIQDANHALWAAFISYLAVRGVMQVLISRRIEGIGKPFVSRYYISAATTVKSRANELYSLLQERYPMADMTKWYETKDATGRSDKIYLNLVMQLDSPMALDQLNSELKSLEIEAGRDRSSDQVALDLDIILQDKKVIRPSDFQQDYFKVGYNQLINARP